MRIIFNQKPPMSRTPNSRKEATHERIVDAAARAIHRHGYAGVGVADVMKEAGLTHGGFYAYFGSRDALIVEALERAGRKSLAMTRATASVVAGTLVGRYSSRALWSNAEGRAVLSAARKSLIQQHDRPGAARH
jgi:AcrR family transcriptional regulator